MKTLRDALRPAARKLSVARSARVLLTLLTVVSMVWTCFVLVVGASSVVLLTLAAIALGVLIVGVATSLSTPTDAARRVERLAGWREKLSTAIELEATGSDNVFYARLCTEVDALIGTHPPQRVLPWRLGRSAVLATVLALVSVGVTVAFPDGLAGVHRARAASQRRENAIDLLESAGRRLEDMSQRSPAVNALRIELVGLLQDIRRGRSTEDVVERARGISRALSGRKSGASADEARRIARALERADALKPLARPLGDMDLNGVRQATGDLARRLADMTAVRRTAAAEAFRNAAGASKLAGNADALTEAERAMRAGEANALRQALGLLTDALGHRRAEERTEDAATAEVRDVLHRVRAALAGDVDPGNMTRRGRAAFFDKTPPTNADATGTGNIALRGRSADIKTVWKEAKAAHPSLPDLDDVIRKGTAVPPTTALDATQRKYIRRYFATEDDNE